MPGTMDPVADAHPTPTTIDGHPTDGLIWPTDDPTAVAATIFTAAWAEQRPPLLAFARAHVAEVATADDIVQEAFTRLWVRLRARPTLRVGAWLFTVTRNLVRDDHRAQGRHPHVAWQAWMADHRSVERAARSDPATLCSAREDAARIRRIVTELPPAYRQVLVWHYWGGRSVAEIAAHLTTLRADAPVRRRPSAPAITTACVKWRLVEARRLVARRWHAPAPPAGLPGGGSARRDPATAGRLDAALITPE